LGRGNWGEKVWRDREGNPLWPNDVWHDGDQAPSPASFTGSNIDRTPVFTTAAVGVAVLVVIALVVFAPEIALPALAFGLI